jgi:hypothetical protein
MGSPINTRGTKGYLECSGVSQFSCSLGTRDRMPWVTKDVTLEAEMVVFPDTNERVDDKCIFISHDTPWSTHCHSESWRIRGLFEDTVVDPRYNVRKMQE